MSSTEVRLKLEKPIFVYLIATCFLLAPIGDLIASMIKYGIPHWYEPDVFFGFIGQVSWVDRVWLMLTFCAGGLLFLQRKGFWVIAMGALVVASCFSLRYGVMSGELARGHYMLTAMFLLSNLSVVAVLYHFRYPYLDRREAWWGVRPRYSCQIPVSGDGLSGCCINLSYSGAFLINLGQELELGHHMVLRLGDITDLKAEIVRKSGDGYGVQFNLSKPQRAQMKKQIADLRLSPMGEQLAA